MLKVLHLISGGDSGGAKTHLFALMQGFQREFSNEIAADIVCFVHEPFYDEAKALGIPIEIYEQKSRTDLKVMDKIAEKINNENYDLVHCHGARANFNSLALRKKISVPMVTTLHSDYLLDFKGNFIKNMIFTPLNVFALKRFRHYIAITEDFKKMLVERGFKADEIEVVYNGFDFEKEENYISREEFLSRHGLERYSSRLLFGMAARLEHVKDQITLLKAIDACRDELLDSHFIIAGEGQERDKLLDYVKMHQLEDRVSFIGEISDPFSLFNAVDVNVLTSLSESFPYALLEGAKMKRPFIATNVGGIPEMAGDSKGAWLFEPQDVDELSQIITEIVKNRDEIHRKGEALYHYVKENFSVGAMAKRHVEIYQKIFQEEHHENH